MAAGNIENEIAQANVAAASSTTPADAFALSPVGKITVGDKVRLFTDRPDRFWVVLSLDGDMLTVEQKHEKPMLCRKLEIMARNVWEKIA